LIQLTCINALLIPNRNLYTLNFFKETVMEVRYLLPIAISLGASATAFAATDGETLFNASNCGMCHAAASASLGPSLKDISAKYAKVAGAQSKLETKVRNGGKGSFGSMPMPATPKSVSDQSIKTIVHWILSQK
jgi:cytochrome c